MAGCRCGNSIFNLNWCRNLCHSGSDDGTLSGRNHPLSADEAVSLTTFYYNALYEQKTINPGKMAINSYDRIMTFGELDSFSTAIAIQIKERIGDDVMVKNPDNELIIAISSAPSEKLITVIFAIIKAGAAYLPLDTSFPEDIVASILRKFVPVLLIGDENSPVFTKFNANRLGSMCEMVSIEELWNFMNLSSASIHKTSTTKQGKGAKGIFVDPIVVDSAILPIDRPAVIFPTTGITTLNPRGIRISHKSIINQLICNWKFLPYDKNGACCLADPPSTIWSVAQIFSPLLKGIPLHILGKKETKDMNTLIRRAGDRKITRLYFQPVMLKDFINECWNIGIVEVHKLLQSLAHVICTGDVMPLSLAHLFFSVFPSGKTLTNNYGWTELCGDVLSETFKNELEVEIKSFQNRVTFGKCMDNTRVGIVGATFEPQPEWCQGEICVTGYPVALGFVDKGSYDIEHVFMDNQLPPTKETEASQKTLFRTGLYGRMVRCQDDRLRVYIEGRGDNLIRHKGFEFSLGDIKTAIQSLGYVKTIEELVFHPGKMDQALVAFVVTKDSLSKQDINSSKEYDLTIHPDDDLSLGELNAAEIEFKLRDKLPDFMIPEIKLLREMPYLKGGARIDEHKLVYLFEVGSEPTDDVWSNMKLPSEDTIQAARVLFLGMYKFCSSSIKICIANMSSSIFDLGVTSLNIVCLTGYLNAKGYEMRLREMLVSMSIRELIDQMVARKIQSKSKDKGKRETIVSLDIKEEYSVKILDQIRSKESFQVIATAYTEKGDLEAYNMVRPSEYMDFLAYYFSAFKEQSICLYATQKPYEEIVAVCIGHDYFTDFNIKMTASLNYVLDIQQEIKGVNLAKFPHKKGKILELFMLGTHAKMTAPENVQLVLLMLGELTNVAERDGYTHIYINSTNQLIRDLCSNVLGYKIVDDYPIKNFLQKDGYRPYRLAPRSVCMTSLCCRIVPDDNRKRLSSVQPRHTQKVKSAEAAKNKGKP